MFSFWKNIMLRKPKGVIWIIIAFSFMFSIPAGLAGEQISHNLLLFTGSLLLLVKSAGYLVSGASRLASYLGVPSIIIGITVVAFGTSLPELMVSVLANLSASAEVAEISIGNVVGSNISNICLVLGIAAILTPIRIHKREFRFDVPFLIGVSMLLPILSLGLFYDFTGARFSIGFLDGLIFLGLFGYFLYRQYRCASENKHKPHRTVTKKEEETRHKKLIGCIALLISGLVGMLISADFLVKSSTGIAATFGVPEVLIGLTMVAVGTSIPELATNIIAALKRKLDIAVGNVIGSNIFNILLVMGTASVMKNIEIISDYVVLVDMPIMIGLTILLALFMKTGYMLHRREGLVLFILYILYISHLFIRAGGL